MRSGCLEDKIQQFINRKKRLVFLRSDFIEISSDYDQVGRALKKIVLKGKLIKVGYGLYVKTKKSSVSGKIIPREGIQIIGTECLKRLKVKAESSTAYKSYNSGKSTQVPTGRVLSVSNRISRKIGFNGINLSFEKTRSKAS